MRRLKFKLIESAYFQTFYDFCPFPQTAFKFNFSDFQIHIYNRNLKLQLYHLEET